jgi:hypothetical protein
MTCREKLRQEHPEWSAEEYDDAIIDGCPDDFGYLDDPDDWCALAPMHCAACWHREIPETEKTDTPPDVQAWIEHMEEKGHIKDSGNRREFETGAVRDMQEGKGRCDLMPLEVVSTYMETVGIGTEGIISNIARFKESEYKDTGALYIALYQFCEEVYDCNYPNMFLEVAKHFEEGAKKYGENNWQKGIPVHCYIDSAVRHYLKWLRGDKDEPHDRAFVWNLMCCIWEVDYREKNDE